MPDPRELDREPRRKVNGWNWPGWLIAYLVTLVVVRDIVLTLLQ